MKAFMLLDAGAIAYVSMRTRHNSRGTKTAFVAERFRPELDDWQHVVYTRVRRAKLDCTNCTARRVHVRVKNSLAHAPHVLKSGPVC